MQVSASVKVIGEVQGVGYRYFALMEARRLGLKGYVRNLRDGSVESEVEGAKSEIERYLASLERGPAFAKVSDVLVEWKPYEAKYQDFRIT